MKRVVITGMGALTPIGNNLNEFWSNLKDGVSGAGPITKFDTTLFKAKFACELKGYDAKNHFDVKDIKKYDPFTQYALVAVAEAIENGKIDFDKH
jgi:3-oxoacyl-[acyl-carrier-protein] synthase II